MKNPYGNRIEQAERCLKVVFAMPATEINVFREPVTPVILMPQTCPTLEHPAVVFGP